VKAIGREWVEVEENLLSHSPAVASTARKVIEE